VIRRRPLHRAVTGATAALTFIAAAGCAGDGTSGPTTTTALASTVVVDGLDHPTQIADGPLGLLLVAQLAGDENAATGEILAIDVTAGTRRVVLDSLDKPTGVLWHDGVLWVMVRRGIVRAPWTGNERTAGPVTVALDGLPFNGRSEGTLTPLDGDTFLYETTGTLLDGLAAPGSGTLWVFDPADGSSRAVATGLKNAYGHVVLGDGRILTTEIGDNVTNAPMEEVDVIDPGTTADLGWPGCPGDTTCSGVVGPLALFPASSTPTGIAVIGDDVFVSLFVTGRLLRVPLEGWATGAPPVAPVQIADGLHGPHSLLARDDGTLWISEHLTGQIISVRP